MPNSFSNKSHKVAAKQKLLSLGGALVQISSALFSLPAVFSAFACQPLF